MIINPRGPKPPVPGVAPKVVTVTVDDSIIGEPPRVGVAINGPFLNMLDVAKWLCAAAADCNRRSVESPGDFLLFQGSIEPQPVAGIAPKVIVVTVDDLVIGKAPSTKTGVSSRVESFNDAARWICVAAANLNGQMARAAYEAARKQPPPDADPKDN